MAWDDIYIDCTPVVSSKGLALAEVPAQCHCLSASMVESSFGHCNACACVFWNTVHNFLIIHQKFYVLFSHTAHVSNFVVWRNRALQYVSLCINLQWIRNVWFYKDLTRILLQLYHLQMYPFTCNYSLYEAFLRIFCSLTQLRKDCCNKKILIYDMMLVITIPLQYHCTWVWVIIGIYRFILYLDATVL